MGSRPDGGLSSLERLLAGDRPTLAALFAASLALQVGLAASATARALKPLGALGVYFDGSYYLEIARSFPLPFPPEALSYAGQAPLYPALIWLLHVATPDAWLDWGLAALWISWLAAAAAPIAFYGLCRSVGVAPLLPTLLFVFANPRWLPIASTAHSEPLAMLFAILTLRFYFEGRLGRCAGMLTLCCLARYPAVLLVVPLGLGLIAERRRIDPRELWVFVWPPLAVAAANLYLFLRIPDFVSIWHAHGTIWPTGFSWPFAALFEHSGWLWSLSPQTWGVTVWVLALSLLSIGLGAVYSRGRELALPLWVALLVFFHMSLEGSWALLDVTRLALLAWPPTLLILCQRLPLRGGLPVGACALLAAASLWFARDNLGWALLIQQTGRDELRLQSDVPVFRVFEGGEAVRAPTRARP